MKYVIFFILGALLLLILISVIITIFRKKKLPVIDNYKEYSKDGYKLAETLSKMIKHPTIDTENQEHAKDFEDYLKTLQSEFPKFFSNAKRIDIDGAYVYKLSGKSNQNPNAILAHSDVVEATGDWKHPPFDGKIADGKIYGRGTIDNKGMYCAVLQSTENLIENGFTPNNDIYFISTMTEESTSKGILNCNKYFLENKIYFHTILDEGGAVTCDAMPGIKNDIALIGLGEKGYIDVKFTAKGSGGHSGAPGKNSPLVRLAKFVSYMESHNVFKIKMLPTVKDMFQCIAPYMNFGMRLLLGNFWLYGGLLKKVLPSISPSIGAMMKTTIAFTRCEGSDSNNVIPESAYVIANMRNICGEDLDYVMERINKIAKKFDLETEVLYYKPASSLTSTSAKEYIEFSKLVKASFKGTIVCPYLTIGATDCCRLDELSDNIFRFSPIRANSEEINAMHGIDEQIGIAELEKAQEFLERYIITL